MNGKSFIKVDIYNEEHCKALLMLLNEYMEDKMGMEASMPKKLGPEIIAGLRKHNAYLGFLVQMDKDYVALANCNRNYSTWQAKFVLNIHDFVVSRNYRKLGIGEFLLHNIENYANENGFCKLTLEVRYDNTGARNLYKKLGFGFTKPQMDFWQKSI